mmetsp:Transcript_9199/g.27412  ORF Transcript_9199/g.27412 Transcript_9199/m.27412 type:complete len:167 (+) Transcript_9199:358-858(+)
MSPLIDLIPIFFAAAKMEESMITLNNHPDDLSLIVSFRPTITRRTGLLQSPGLYLDQRERIAQALPGFPHGHPVGEEARRATGAARELSPCPGTESSETQFGNFCHASNLRSLNDTASEALTKRPEMYTRFHTNPHQHTHPDTHEHTNAFVHQRVHRKILLRLPVT